MGGAYAAPGSDFDALVEKFKGHNNASMQYELYALCEHQGSQMQDGHYIAYVNSGPSLKNEEWYGMSDTKVWKCERAEILKVEAYIAFYRRADVSSTEDKAAAVVAESSETVEKASD